MKDETDRFSNAVPNAMSVFNWSCREDLHYARDGKKRSGKNTEICLSNPLMSIIRGSKQGVDRATLTKKTGFEGRKVGDIVYRKLECLVVCARDMGVEGNENHIW